MCVYDLEEAEERNLSVLVGGEVKERTRREERVSGERSGARLRVVGDKRQKQRREVRVKKVDKRVRKKGRVSSVGENCGRRGRKKEGREDKKTKQPQRGG